MIIQWHSKKYQIKRVKSEQLLMSIYIYNLCQNNNFLLKVRCEIYK